MTADKRRGGVIRPLGVLTGIQMVEQEVVGWRPDTRVVLAAQVQLLLVSFDVMRGLFFHRHPRGRYRSGPSDLYFGRAVSL